MAAETSFITFSRFERKYRVNSAQYFALKNALYAFIQKDHYTQSSPRSRYLVRSLYYDTDDYKLFIEKMGGDSNRIKFRIRTYGNSHAENPDIRVELKVRRANQSIKYSTFIDMEEYLDFMKTNHWPNKEDKILHEFERHLHLFNLHPKSLVEYYREGYQTRDGQNIRLTFDHNIRSMHANQLFPSTTYWQSHYEQGIVFEIKHQNQLPRWLNAIIKDHGLTLVANSKFALGIQVNQPDIIY
jgi:hypothetical protein